MTTTEMTHPAELNDAGLVAESLDGNLEAFRQIVERYQALISSLAYCATGDLSQSEDLSQQTFITAWKQLADLREPKKLRQWLCSIVRFLVSKEFRRQAHEPIHHAESLDAVDEWPSQGVLPPDYVMSEEEKAMLWRSLERIPDVYREPLVLFYREDQSIAAVARDLELSEDAVKQRLSRGRKLLQEQLFAFVAGALKQTRPGKPFAAGVMAALPLLAGSAQAATVTAAASKGTSVTKAATVWGSLSAFLTGGAMLLFSLLAVFAFAGRWLGGKMGLASRESLQGRQRVIQFWRTLAVGFLLFVLPPLLVSDTMIHSYPWIFRAQTWSLAAFYGVVATALVIWTRQRCRSGNRPDTQAAYTMGSTDKSYTMWITLGMIGPAFILGAFLFALFFSNRTWSSKHISQAEAERTISERQDARFTVYQYQSGSKSLSITLPENHRIGIATPLNDSVLAALTRKGITFKTRVEGRDFQNGGVRGWLVLLSTFIVVTGTLLIMRRAGTRQFSSFVKCHNVLLGIVCFSSSTARLNAADSFFFTNVTAKSLALFEGGRPVFVYNHGIIHQPGVPADRARSTYVHPLYGLDGEVLTDDFPEDHYHHRGLFWAWPHVRIGAEHYDLWMLKGIEQRFERWLAREAQADGATLGVENGWFVGGRKVMRERVWLHVTPAGQDGRILEIELAWVPLTEPLTLEGAEGKSYGGLTIRFAPRTQTVITTPLGQSEKDLSIARLPWADLSGRFAGRSAASGAAIFVAPDHPDYPPEWLTRHYGALCLGWPGVKSKTFPPGETIRCRYRVWVHRGAPNVKKLAEAYHAYEQVPASTLEKP